MFFFIYLAPKTLDGNLTKYITAGVIGDTVIYWRPHFVTVLE